MFSWSGFDPETRTPGGIYCVKFPVEKLFRKIPTARIGLVSILLIFSPEIYLLFVKPWQLVF
jgi:hypothetical protein